jgi:hypothetical protein
MRRSSFDGCLTVVLANTRNQAGAWTLRPGIEELSMEQEQLIAMAVLDLKAPGWNCLTDSQPNRRGVTRTRSEIRAQSR